MIISISSGSISTEALFLNALTGVDMANFWVMSFQQEMVGNITFNPINGNKVGAV